jgi:hypothetical protein
MRITLLIVFVAVSFSCFGQQKDAEGFALVFSDPSISIYERWVEFPNKKPVIVSREFKSEFSVNTSIHKIINLIKDEAQVKLWQAHLRSYKIYAGKDTTVWDEYSCHDIPWPLSDQDSFLEYKLSEVIPGKEYAVDFKSAINQKVAPLNDDIHRIELVGRWRFVLISPGVVRVTYRIQSAPATSLPRMIIDPVVRNNLVASIKSLTEIAEK